MWLCTLHSRHEPGRCSFVLNTPGASLADVARLHRLVTVVDAAAFLEGRNFAVAVRRDRDPDDDLRFMATHLDRAVMAAANYTVEKAPEKGWPWYLKAIGASAACAGTGAYIALLMHHELGFRRFCESISPALVDLVRQRYPFADEDPERRAYLKKLEAELATPRTVAFEGRRVEVDGEASASECRDALGIACDLDIDIEDVELSLIHI